jgi:hypothetical protein
MTAVKEGSIAVSLHSVGYGRQLVDWFSCRHCSASIRERGEINSNAEQLSAFKPTTAQRSLRRLLFCCGNEPRQLSVRMI